MVSPTTDYACVLDRWPRDACLLKEQGLKSTPLKKVNEVFKIEILAQASAVYLIYIQARFGIW